MFTTWGALTGLAIAIVLIVRKATPAYALVLGALLGGILGGGSLPETVGAMISGGRSAATYATFPSPPKVELVLSTAKSPSTPATSPTSVSKRRASCARIST